VAGSGGTNYLGTEEVKLRLKFIAEKDIIRGVIIKGVSQSGRGRRKWRGSSFNMR